MTSNQVEIMKVKENNRHNVVTENETQRHNKRQEKLDKRGQNMKLFGDLTGTVTKAATAAAVNDPSWYNKDKQLVKDVANLSFHNPLGALFPNKFNVGQSMPGICALHFVPTLGKTENIASSNVADVAGKNIYAYVRHANSGSRNYEANDLMMYLLAMDNVYSYWAAARRIYDKAKQIKGENRYYNEAVLRALGVDPDSFRNNLAQFRSWINTFATRANSLYVPKGLPLFQRHAWMNTHTFKDQALRKSQIYMYVQDFYYMYDPINGKLTTTLPVDELPWFQPTDISSSIRFRGTTNDTLIDITTFMRFGNTLINSLLASEDIGIMSGDILKAYGESNLWFLDSTPEDYHVEDTYSLEVLSQIQNTTITNTFLEYASNDIRYQNYFDISQNEGSYIDQGVPLYAPGTPTKDIVGIPVGPRDTDAFIFSSSSMLSTLPADEEDQNVIKTDRTIKSSINYVINFYKDETNVDETMVATRNMAGLILGPNNGTDDLANIYSRQESSNGFLCFGAAHYGTEIFNAMMIYFYHNSGQTLRDVGKVSLYGLCFRSNILSGGVQSFNAGLQQTPQVITSLINKFSWAPILYLPVPSEIQTDTFNSADTMDASNYTTINVSVLDNMHYAAILSEFGVPDLGMKVRSR